MKRFFTSLRGRNTPHFRAFGAVQAKSHGTLVVVVVVVVVAAAVVVVVVAAPATFCFRKADTW